MWETLEQFFATYWPELLGLLVVVLLVALLLWYRKKKAEEPEEPEPEEDALPKGALTDAWRSFRDALSDDGRDHLDRAQHFVVLGSSGSGKTSLITACTDWEDKARQFFPSHTDDPNLQIYLATHQISLELSSTLLAGGTEDVEAACSALWKKLYRRRAPIVLLALNASLIERASVGQIRELATSARAQLNLIAKAAREPVRMQVVLFGADHLTGFAPLSRLLSAAGQELRLPLRDKRPLAAALADYHVCLPMALESDASFRSVMRFFQDAPRTWLPPVQSLAELLRRPDPLLATPALEDLYLVSSDPEDGSGNPFHLRDERSQPIRLRDIRHHLAAAALALIFGGGALLQYLHERSDLSADIAALEALDPSAEIAEAFPTPGGLVDVFASLPRCGRDRLLGQWREKALSGLDPNRASRATCRAAQEEVGAHIAHHITSELLAPTLQYAADTGDMHDLLLTAALILTTHERDDPLNRIITAQTGVWASDLAVRGREVEGRVQARALTEPEILSYISMEVEARPDLPGFSFNAEDDYSAWEEFVEHVADAMGQPLLSQAQLEEIREEAEALQNAPLHQAILEALQAQGLQAELGERGIDLDSLGVQDSAERADDAGELAEVLGLIAATPICALPDLPPAELSLKLLLEEIEGCVELTHGALQVHNLGAFAFKPREWEALASRTNAAAMLATFEDRIGDASPLVDQTRYAPVLMPSEYGGSTDRVTVDGIYTREAVLSEVYPVLNGLEKRLDRIELTGEPREKLEDYIDESMNAYAARYAGAWETFYSGYRADSRSRTQIQITLDNYTSFHGALCRFLVIIEEHTRLPESDSPYARALFRELRPFQSIAALMGEPEAADPSQGPIADYLAIVDELATRFQTERAEATFAGEAAADDAGGLAAQLPLAGQMALAALQDDENAYRTLVVTLLDAQGIGAPWQAPFLAPFDDIYALGARDIEDALHENWYAILPRLEVMIGLYPFDRYAEDEISPDDLTEELHPAGRLWTEFAANLAPALERVDRRWRVRSASGVRPRPPGGMLELSNHLALLTDALWDADGAEQALPLEVRPMPLPWLEAEGYFATDAWLVLNDQQIHAYNQDADYKPMPVAWWDQSEAQLLLQISGKRRAQPSPLAHQIHGSEWAFFKLLDRAEKSADVWRWYWDWSVPGEVPGGRIRVRYQMDNDPRGAFRFDLDSPMVSRGGR